uniref:(northern house mosquito) hypothetical protein n=1 Tax=Culex pipiens TaxID=7175 RepID=A0A8D8BN20_CULPI
MKSIGIATWVELGCARLIYDGTEETRCKVGLSFLRRLHNFKQALKIVTKHIRYTSSGTRILMNPKKLHSNSYLPKKGWGYCSSITNYSLSKLTHNFYENRLIL